MKAKNFDKKKYDFDLSTIKRPNQKRINVDFPFWVVDPLDREASRIDVTRQSLSSYGWLSGLKKKSLTNSSTRSKNANQFSAGERVCYA